MLLVFSHVIESLEEIVTHQVAIYQNRVVTKAGTNADNRVFNVRGVDDRAFGYDGFVEASAAYFSRRQHTWTSVNGVCIVEQIEGREIGCQCEVRLKESA